jgi:hypothetical protein
MESFQECRYIVRVAEMFDFAVLPLFERRNGMKGRGLSCGEKTFVRSTRSSLMAQPRSLGTSSEASEFLPQFMTSLPLYCIVYSE